MLSLSSLLNPTPPRPPPHAPPLPVPQFLPSPTISSPATSYTDEVSSSRLDRGPVFTKFKMPKDSVSISKSKPRGTINFYPFEDVDEAALQEIRRFRVTPFGQIQNSCAHIPYNSGKKDFYEKTGRESFEVFKYDFRVPGSDAEYTVMWDYNVGLVRMTPFFKCCKYGKTVPAKMLSMNPGLKDVTHSITGGAISAQGYWMPYKCAKAVCATFCYEIAGALIPIFGPSFPARCIPPGAPDFQRMIIDPRIIYEAQREAEIWRRDYHRGTISSGVGYTSLPAPTPSPGRSDRRPVRAMRETERRLRVDTRMLSLSTYSTDTDADGHLSGPDSASSSSSGPPGYAYQYQPVPQVPDHRHGSGWTAVNPTYPPTTVPPSHQPPSMFRDHHHHHHQQQQGYQQPPPNPLLSAVPRFAPPQLPLSFHHTLSHHPPTQGHRHGHTHAPRSQPSSLPRTTWPAKRPIVHDDLDQGYEGGESQRGSPALEYIAQKRREEERGQGQGQGQGQGPPGLDLAEKKAALLLMNLSVQDQVLAAAAAGECSGGGRKENGEGSPDSHRSKRRRATSF
ncbi:hypothetical protein SODALDRAFT_348800 [Sodiomyces alkalinus F11]|uniref:HTH APSES-type domain-containing protein n=1 Tax=Sodiomyces alkalinus (strain CBS 110278 / VKM F-3762 / F11) TaxID=1314773 RepID=A0A3N2Q1G1_SODAK|nr:hypothetical protein SODALDRAFT_348800 [Sodiomyces alkalinus F11]ROT40594.1 hypothetical protein SODALDRAFT_348800 [Sodiomyces alkalinus F11]